MTSLSTAPTGSKLKLDFLYDSQGRRIQKIVSTNNGSAYYPQSTNRFIYDGWNLIAVLNPQSALVRSFVWGLDLSGSLQGAGGVGGLLEVNDAASGVHFAAFDGNGNVAGLVKAADGTVSAQYEFGPFGEVIRATGPMAKANPFRFSTKYQDDETDLLYYGYRYYNASTGRWLSRDPIQERGGRNLYGFVGNDSLTRVDPVGLTTGQMELQCCRKPPGYLPTSRKLSLHIGFVAEAFPTGLGAFLTGLAYDISVTVPIGKDILDVRSKIEGLLRPGDCINRITFTGHGSPGNLGGSVNSGIWYGDLLNKKSHQSQLLEYLGTRTCKDCCETKVRACEVAKGALGETFLKAMARLLNSEVVGYADWYGPWPHGEEYTAFPNGNFAYTGEYPSWKDSLEGGLYTGSLWTEVWNDIQDAAIGPQGP